MLLSQLVAIKNSKKSLVTIAVMIGMVFLSQINAWYTYFMNYSGRGFHGAPADEMINPPTAAFLSANSSGDLFIILIVALPIFLILINAHLALDQGPVTGHWTHYLRLGSLNRGLLRSECANFGIFTAFFAALFGFDFLISIIIFHRGTDFLGLEVGASSSHLLNMEISHSYLAYSMFVIVVSAAFGLYAVVIYALVLLVKKAILAYTLSFGFWLLMIVMPHSMSYFMQPFIEYDWNDYLASLLWFFGICFLVIVGCNLMIKFISRHYYFN
ncbi:hypothetical protein ACFQ22_13015 [Lentilactobacillus raoultii]|uniref:DUF998 domain-containing protein n=1 Tax=Lentilactobacillus raoultii TaxID=1987503 RepID=A0ABW3PLQ8_9LACO|nr:hypothetical protein [Lentilactobacillus raoultii]